MKEEEEEEESKKNTNRTTYLCRIHSKIHLIVARSPNTPNWTRFEQNFTFDANCDDANGSPNTKTLIYLLNLWTNKTGLLLAPNSQFILLICVRCRFYHRKKQKLLSFQLCENRVKKVKKKKWQNENGKVVAAHSLVRNSDLVVCASPAYKHISHKILNANETVERCALPLYTFLLSTDSPPSSIRGRLCVASLPMRMNQCEWWRATETRRRFVVVCAYCRWCFFRALLATLSTGGTRQTSELSNDVLRYE